VIHLRELLDHVSRIVLEPWNAGEASLEMSSELVQV